MNKSDLIAALAAKENLTDKQATEIINLIFTGFTDTLKKGDRIEIRGFGSYSVRNLNKKTSHPDHASALRLEIGGCYLFI